MHLERTSTGTDGLDGLIEGGFPRGSLILLAGKPGTGKTVFAAHFLYNGALRHGENGVYVSFAEDRKTFMENMLGYGLDFEELEREGKTKILDLVTVKEEAISTILEMILGEIHSLKAKRLVIDSFSAMVQAFKEMVDARIVLHTILGKIARQAGCTTLLIAEVPMGEERVGVSIEEFVADGVLILRRGMFDGRLIREVELAKLRGTRIAQPLSLFTLHKGFQVFRPFEPKPFRGGRFKPISDPLGKFSTGAYELDRLLDGGYPKGSAVLLEVNEQISTIQYHLILCPTPWNFLARGRAVMAIPSSGVDYNIIKRCVVEAGFTEDEINRLLRVCVPETPEAPKEPYIATFEGKNLEEDYQKYLRIEEELMNETGQPVMRISGADAILSRYGKDAAMKIWNLDATRIREKESLGILILKPGYTEASKILGAIADIHLKLTGEHGALILYGIKPRTGIHVVEMDVSKGYPLPKLTSIT